MSKISGEQKKTVSSLQQPAVKKGDLDANKNKKAQTPSSALRQAPTLINARFRGVALGLLALSMALRSLMPPLLRQ